LVVLETLAVSPEQQVAVRLVLEVQEEPLAKLAAAETPAV